MLLPCRCYLFVSHFLQVGTYQIALVAKALKKPFYVAVESYKFARMYPLSQRDVRGTDAAHVFTAESTRNDEKAQDRLRANFNVEEGLQGESTSWKSPPVRSSPTEQQAPGVTAATLEVPIGNKNSRVELPSTDFTPAELITLLFTDIGVLTPAAVSDELIKLYT